MPQKYTEARKEGNRRWDAANLDRISVAMPKGKRELIKSYAEERGESVNAFVNRAIDETMERDGKKTTPKPTPTAKSHTLKSKTADNR